MEDDLIKGIDTNKVVLTDYQYSPEFDLVFPSSLSNDLLIIIVNV